MKNNLAEQFAYYAQQVYEKNQLFNLTGYKSLAEIKTHLVDEIIALFADLTTYFANKKVVDLGSGNGCPGILLTLLYEVKKMVLVDSKQKKIHFLDTLIKEMNLKNTTTENIRIEEFVQKNKNQFDVVVSRSLTTIDKVNVFARELLKPKGIVFHIKNTTQQLEEYNNQQIKPQFKLVYQKQINQPRTLFLFTMEKYEISRS